MSSPTQRSLALLKKEGWTCQVVEKWLPARGSMKFGRRIDLFGFADIVAMRDGQIALVQTCSAGDVQKRIAKIKDLATFGKWHRAGGIVIVHGWHGYRYKGDANKTWSVRVFTTQKHQPVMSVSYEAPA